MTIGKKCPQCGNNLFQKIELGKISKEASSNQLEFTSSKTILVCAKCARQITCTEDWNPPKYILHVTGNSESRKRRSVTQAGFTTEQYQGWEHKSVLILNDHIFITKDDYENENLLPPAAVYDKRVEYDY